MKSRRVSLSRPRDLSSAFCDIDDELACHLELLMDELRHQGLPEEELQIEVCRRFGPVERTRNVCRRLAVKEMIMNRKTAVIVGVVFALLLVVCLATTSLLLSRRAAVARERALAHAMQAREMAMEAETQRRTAEATSAFLEDLLTGVDPVAATRETSVREILDAASRRLDLGAVENREVEARLRKVIEAATKGLEKSDGL